MARLAGPKRYLIRGKKAGRVVQANSLKIGHRFIQLGSFDKEIERRFLIADQPFVAKPYQSVI
jgi:hypothetical protein